jgi:hypothetical protein
MRKDAAIEAHVPRARRPRLQALAPRERRSLLQPDAPLAGALAGEVVAEYGDLRAVRAFLSASLLRAERERGPADR